MSVTEHTTQEPYTVRLIVLGHKRCYSTPWVKTFILGESSLRHKTKWLLPPKPTLHSCHGTSQGDTVSNPMPGGQQRHLSILDAPLTEL